MNTTEAAVVVMTKVGGLMPPDEGITISIRFSALTNNVDYKKT